MLFFEICMNKPLCFFKHKESASLSCGDGKLLKTGQAHCRERQLVSRKWTRFCHLFRGVSSVNGGSDFDMDIERQRSGGSVELASQCCLGGGGTLNEFIFTMLCRLVLLLLAVQCLIVCLIILTYKTLWKCPLDNFINEEILLLIIMHWNKTVFMILSIFKVLRKKKVLLLRICVRQNGGPNTGSMTLSITFLWATSP